MNEIDARFALWNATKDFIGVLNSETDETWVKRLADAKLQVLAASVNWYHSQEVEEKAN